MPTNRTKALKWVVLALILIVIALLQINYRNFKANEENELRLALEMTFSPYSKILLELPVHRDSLYNIYITNVNQKPHIIFFAPNGMTDVQLRSKFFVHVYPSDKKFLPQGENLMAFDFKKPVDSFVFRKKTYFFFAKELPEIQMHKINLGQYGYLGDNRVNWKIPEPITNEKIARVLYDNGEKIPFFERRDKL